MGSKTPVRTPDNLRSKDEFEILIGLGEGPIQGLVDGDKSFYVGDTPLQNQDDSYNFELFKTKLYPGEAVAEEVETRLGGLSNNTSVGVNLFSGTAVTRQTESGAIDYLEVRLVVNQLYEQNDDGIFNASATFRIEYKPANASASSWSKFYGQDLTIHGKTTSAYAVEYRQAVKRMSCPYDIRVTKVSPESTTTYFFELTWESFQEIDAEPRAYNNTAIIQVSGQATDQLASIPQFKGIYRGLKVKVPTNYNPITRAYTGLWDGTFKIAWTNNPAWILYDIVTNTRYGIASYTSINFDKYDVYDAAQWCDTSVSDGQGWVQPRYTFNSVIQDARNGKELARYVAGVFNAAIIDNMDGSLGLRVDRDDPAERVFTPENVIDGVFEYSYTDTTNRYNDITVTFVNPDLDWQEDRRRVYDAVDIANNGRIPLDFIAVGCTNAAEAIRRAQYKMLTCLTEKEMVRFSTNRQGMFLKEWDVILIADPDMGYSVTGRIKSINNARTHITLRDPLYLETGIDYVIKVQYANAIIEREVLPTSTGLTTTLVLPTPLPSGVPTNAVFSLEDQAGGLNGLAKPYRVLTIGERDGNPDQFEITAIEINRLKFDDADSLDEIDEVDYRRAPVSNVAPPTNLTFTNVSFTATDGTYRPRLRVDWTPPVGMVNITYEVQYRLATDTAFENTIVIPDGVTFAVLTVLEDRKDWTVRVRAKNTLGLYSDWVEATSEDELPNDAPPGTCTGLTATGSFKSISLQWSNPTDSDLKLIQVWSSTANNINTATLLAEVYTTFFVHNGLGTGATRYYWVRAVDRSGNVGEFNSNLGTGATTIGVTGDDVAVEDFIDQSILLKDLTTGVLQSPDLQSLQESVLQLLGIVNDRFTEIRGLRGDDRRTVAGVIENVNTVTADLEAEVTTRTLQYAANADAIALHESQITTLVGDLEAETTARTVLAATVADNTAAIATESTTRATQYSALASSLTTLTATVSGNTAAISTEVTARVNGDNALASSISSLSTTVGSNTASISTIQTSVNGLEAKYVVKVDINGYVTGFGLASSANTATPTSEFTIVADKFAFVKPGGTPGSPIVPFVISTVGASNVLRFQGKIIADSIDDLSIATGKIAAQAVTANLVTLTSTPTTVGSPSPTYHATVSASVPSGEIGNYLFRISARCDFEFDPGTSGVVQWRLVNNLVALTSFQTLCMVNAPADEPIYDNEDPPNIIGYYAFPGSSNAYVTTQEVDYFPVSTSETAWAIEAYHTSGSGIRIKNAQVAIMVFKR